MSSSLAARGLATRVARFGLDTAGDEEEEILEIPDLEWPEFFGVLDFERLTGLALASIEANRLRLADSQSELISSVHRTAMLQSLALERKLLAVAEAFEDAAIETVVLKGPVLAHVFYEDPSLRPFVDIDLLVRSRDWRKACDLLAEIGVHRLRPPARPGFDERFGKAAVHMFSDGLQLDLHRTLVVGPFGLWMEPDELFDRRMWLRLGGRNLPRLNDTALFLHQCIHASLGERTPRLLPLRDVALIAASGVVEWDTVSDWCRRWKLGAVISHALRTVIERLGVRLPEGADALLTPVASRQESRLLEAYTTDRRGRGGTALSTIRAIPEIRSKAAYVRGLLFPARDFLEARAQDGAGPSYLRRWAIPIKWITDRPGVRQEKARRPVDSGVRSPVRKEN